MAQTKIPSHRFKRIHPTPLQIGAVGLVFTAGLLGAYWHFVHNQPKSKQIVTAGTPVESNIQKPSGASAPPEKKPSGDQTGSRNAGGATDTKGQAPPSTSPSEWVSSASGLITVKQPTANSKLTSGASVGGTAKVNEIKYRLNDNKVGVIAQGTLSVVNDKFSGVLHFSPQGTGGRLDIFSTDSLGREYNEVQINVSF